MEQTINYVILKENETIRELAINILTPDRSRLLGIQNPDCLVFYVDPDGLIGIIAPDQSQRGFSTHPPITQWGPRKGESLTEQLSRFPLEGRSWVEHHADYIKNYYDVWHQSSCPGSTRAVIAQEQEPFFLACCEYAGYSPNKLGSF